MFTVRTVRPKDAAAATTRPPQFLGPEAVATDPTVCLITGWPFIIGDAFAADLPRVMPLPTEPFDAARLLEARVDHRARVSMRHCYYSVPVRYAGRRLPVRLSAMTVAILDGPRVVARHERAAGKYVEVLTLDHYLEVLKFKPGPRPGATALAQEKACVVFTGTHQRYWDAARREHGDAGGAGARCSR